MLIKLAIYPIAGGTAIANLNRFATYPFHPGTGGRGSPAQCGVALVIFFFPTKLKSIARRQPVQRRITPHPLLHIERMAKELPLCPDR